MVMTPITIVVASTENGVIGKDNDMPWKMKSDLKHFKDLTTSGEDNHIVMGRNTFESLGNRCLPGRTTHVITRDVEKVINQNESAYAHTSIEEALSFIRQAEHMSEKPFSIWIVGGASIYNYCLENNLVNKVVQTIIHANVEGDTYFYLPEDSWDKKENTKYPKGKGDDYDYSIVSWIKQQS
jgi:dihydrofolate reductase